MALIYAGGQWRNVPDSAVANAQSPTPARVQNNAQGSSPAAVAAMIQNATAAAPVVQPTQTTTPEVPRDPAPGPSGPSAADIQRMIDDALARERNAVKTQRDQEAIAFLGDILTQYGMGDLRDSINSLVQEWGNNTSVIANNLRQTQSYKDRFKGLLTLQQKGVNDVRNEAEYIALESSYRQVFRDAGIQSYLGNAGSREERDAIARLAGDYSLSVNEVKSRVQDAQRVVNDTASEVRDALRDYYNINASDLVAFTLDPTRTKDRINDIANAAMFGGYATRAGLSADRGTAEQVASLSQGNDMSLQNTVAQLGGARQVRDATKRLANLEATDLTDSDILRSEFNLYPDTKERVKTLQSRERARFSGSSAVGRDTLATSTGI